MSAKVPLETVTISEAIERLDIRIKEVESEIAKMLDNVQDNYVKGIVAHLILLGSIRANQNILRISSNVWKIDDLTKADKNIKDLIQPILDIIVESEKHPFAI
jgi:hypothetical protein